MAVLLVMAALGLIVIVPILLLGGSGRRSECDPDDPAHTAGSQLSALGALGAPGWGSGIQPRPARGEPIERLSADLRRLRGRICSEDPRESAGHDMSLRRAYDQALSDACELLGVEHELDEDTAGIDRDLERLRVEAELEGRGIVLSRPPSGHTT